MNDKTETLKVDLSYDILTDFNEKLSTDFLEWVLSVEEFNMLFMEQNECGEEDLPVLTINISSPGGIVSEMFRMLSAISILPNLIIVRAIGMVASSALFFYLAVSDIRLSTPYTEFLCHTISYSIGQTNLENHRQCLKDSDKLQKKIDDIIKSKTKITQKQLTKHKNDDWILTNDEAIDLGIVTYKGTLNELYTYMFPEEEDEENNKNLE